MSVIEEGSVNTTVSNWHIFGQSLPKTEIVFFCQVILIYVVVVTSIVNLAIVEKADTQIWIALLSSCLGYILPNPSLNFEKRSGQK